MPITDSEKRLLSSIPNGKEDGEMEGIGESKEGIIIHARVDNTITSRLNQKYETEIEIVN